MILTGITALVRLVAHEYGIRGSPMQGVSGNSNVPISFSIFQLWFVIYSVGTWLNLRSNVVTASAKVKSPAALWVSFLFEDRSERSRDFSVWIVCSVEGSIFAATVR